MNQVKTLAAAAKGMSGLERQHETIAGRRSGPGIWKVLGFQLETAEPGRATLISTPREELRNAGSGGMHGGWVGTFLDSCMASAVSTMMQAGQASTTLEFKVNIIRPILPGTPVRAIGTTQHVGRSTGIASGEIRGIEDDRLYATGTTTCMVFNLPKDS
ncbi:PaaI family thioesterase [Pseudooceanicola sp.]|uniref:PaaI family thioesterase n=1 Tax=Pseudooceanicola sp. TaxID=1914328 RepID=UPI0026093CED|nr:PaaI family thioesterase [Pseudooceanicola sp.]MDF1853910.1 PaaI family thioesterase [Pseudooceanicola sp.]